MQGLCRHFAQMWATSDGFPRFGVKDSHACASCLTLYGPSPKGLMQSLRSGHHGDDCRARRHSPKAAEEAGGAVVCFWRYRFCHCPLYSTFIRQDEYVCRPLACLLMLLFFVSRRVVNGTMRLPQDRLWLLREVAQAPLHYHGFAYAFPLHTTPSWAVARLCVLPDCAQP